MAGSGVEYIASFCGNRNQSVQICCCPGMDTMRCHPTGSRHIELAVAQVFGIEPAAIGKNTRGRAREALARQTAMYLAHVACGLKLTDVGRLFQRDRTTVSHACAVIEDRRDDPRFDRALELLELVAQSLTAPRPGSAVATAASLPPAGFARA